MDNLWWGYKHVNDTVHVKRFLLMGDIEEAQDSPFVAAVYGPFEANDYKHALHVLQLKMHGIE